ncbi:MAG: xanthine dehydrogenase family protein subunit M [Ignavibacteriota bacterium]|nr:MAG: xanthine dehydrogenase family protein subunit M [Chlorobiota bacterium]MBL1121877.1 xanthine dehydrogenase family protein subunit M [Ignavibacteriota bacterium]MCE7857216.1 xanthine dehydrogenase family protein subunit M [Ignavibacteria bacterium CHB3]QKJ96823.1 MAG: xanthine dehydrogenase family protein subunit M [Ignavibacteriota bacterium]GIK60288.1 MAG: dehydrogenase [Ignavibacteriota bacterium]
MYLPDFIYHKPQNLQEACSLLEKSENGAAIAGGTDVLVEMKKELRNNNELISLSGISELKIINEDDKNLYIGAAVTHNEIIESSLIKKSFSVLSETAKEIGSDQIRNTGTIGGNLCTGASCCDMAPVLIAGNANLEVVSVRSKRNISIKDFFLNHKKTSLEKGEILSRIIIPKVKAGSGISFLKFGLREAASISVASSAVMIRIDGNVVADSMVVVGAVAPTPVVSKSASDILNGEKIDEIETNLMLLDKVGEAVKKDSLPIDDIRGSAYFRRNLVKTLSQRTLIEAINRAKKSLKK